ncbi:MAG: hypothetical protein ABIH66_13900 [bacterium]
MNGDTALGLVALDLLGLQYPDIVEMAGAAGEKMGIPAGNIIIHSIHTHSAPDTVGLWGGGPKGYKKKLKEGVAKCLADASAALRPAEARFASGRVEGRNINRRHPDTKKADETMAVMELAEPGGGTIATLVNFACHPVALGADSRKITADFIHYLRNRMEADRGGVSLYFSRDLGDANPPAVNEDVYDRAGGTFELARELGEALAGDAAGLLENAAGGPVDIRMSAKELAVEVENPKFMQLLKSGLMKRKVKNGAVLTAVAIVDLGPAQILTFPGEALTGVGNDVAPLLPGPHRFMFGLTYDSIGYIVPQREWDGSRYEESVSVGPSLAPALKKKVRGDCGGVVPRVETASLHHPRQIHRRCNHGRVRLREITGLHFTMKYFRKHFAHIGKICRAPTPSRAEGGTRNNQSDAGTRPARSPLRALPDRPKSSRTTLQALC